MQGLKNGGSGLLLVQFPILREAASESCPAAQTTFSFKLPKPIARRKVAALFFAS